MTAEMVEQPECAILGNGRSLPQGMVLLRDGLTARQNLNSSSTVAIQASQPLCIGPGICYFEVLVLDMGHTGSITVGLTEKEQPLSRLPGWELRSYGYEVNTGDIHYGGSKIGSAAACTCGDILGCGIHNGEVFLTKNGRVIGQPIPMASNQALWPTIGFRSPGACCTSNFGQLPFKCEVTSALGLVKKRKNGVRDSEPTRSSAHQTCLAATGKTWLKVLRDNCTARASGRRQPKDVVAVRSTASLSTERGLYFEVLIVATGVTNSVGSRMTRNRASTRAVRSTFVTRSEKSSNRGRSVSTPHQRPLHAHQNSSSSCEVTVGLCMKKTGSLLHAPGDDSISYGYSGNDGSKRNNGIVQPFGEMFGVGDLIGCGWDPLSGCIYYSKNGVSLGVAFHGVNATKLYPTVGLGVDGELIRVNFESSWLASPVGEHHQTMLSAVPEEAALNEMKQNISPTLCDSKTASNSPQNATAVPIQEHALELSDTDCKLENRAFSPIGFCSSSKPGFHRGPRKAVVVSPTSSPTHHKQKPVRGIVTEHPPAQLKISALQPGPTVIGEECSIIEKPETLAAAHEIDKQVPVRPPPPRSLWSERIPTPAESTDDDDAGVKCESSICSPSPPAVFITGLESALKVLQDTLQTDSRPASARSIPDDLLSPSCEFQPEYDKSEDDNELINSDVVEEDIDRMRHPRFRLQAAGRAVGHFSLRAMSLRKSADDVSEGTSEVEGKAIRVSDGDEEVNVSWRKGNMLGQGAFGEVFLGLDEDSGALMAVKQFEVPTADCSVEQQKWIKSLKLEIGMLAAFDHPNIVRYIGVQQRDHLLYILMEYMPGGSIEALLRRFGPFKERMTRHYLRQILSGLGYLHAAGVVHRDIKGANILLSSDGAVKLADFGASKRIECVMTNSGTQVQNSLKLPAFSRTNSLKDGALKSLKGTPYWMAPEVLSGDPDGTKGDIWSVGCVVCEMMTGRPPFAEKNFTNAIALMMHIASDGTVPETPEGLSDDGLAFLAQCFKRDASTMYRPDAQVLLQHSFAQAPA